MPSSLQDLQDQVRIFRDERGWERFHSPSSLAAAISVEAGELLELFLWKSPEQAVDLGYERRKDVESELADITLFVLNLANRLEIDLEAAIRDKLEVNSDRFPIHKHGNSPPSRKR